MTEALPFTLSVNGRPHHMLVQVFAHDALMLDQDAQQDNTTTPGVQVLAVGLDYLRTIGLPAISLQAQQKVWAQVDTALFDAAGSIHQIAHIAQFFPLNLLGDASWVGGMPWYHVQWSLPKGTKSGWLAASALTFQAPSGNPLPTASVDLLSSGLATYLNGIGSNVGVALYDMTRQRFYTYNATTQFTMASSMKVPILFTFLDFNRATRA